MIPQGPSVNSIGFWFPSQRKLNFAMSENCSAKSSVSSVLLAVNSRLCRCQSCDRYPER